MRFNLERSGPLIGVGGVFTLLFVAFWAFLWVPWWGIAMILGLLALQWAIIGQLAKTRPTWCAFVPAFGLFAYFALIFTGVHWWGWHP